MTHPCPRCGADIKTKSATLCQPCGQFMAGKARAPLFAEAGRIAPRRARNDIERTTPSLPRVKWLERPMP